MTNLINFGKIICSVRKYGENKIPQSIFYEVIVEYQIYGENSAGLYDYKKHVEICESLDLIKQNSGNLVLTDEGIEYYNSISTNAKGEKIIDIITEDLKNKIIRKIIQKKEFLEKEFDKSTVIIEPIDGEPCFTMVAGTKKKMNQNVIELLKELDLISFQKTKYEISSKISDKVKKPNAKPLSEKQLYDILKKQQEVGARAEQLTIESETKRLKNMGVEEIILKRISRKSKSDVSAGYDIDSFEGSKIGIKHDRFIEVKGTTSGYPVFYWSENERDAAQKLGEKYFIYVWTNIGKANEKLSSIIKNPHHEIVEKKYEKIQTITTWQIDWYGDEDSLKKYNH